MQHEKCYTSCPLGAMLNLCVLEYLQIKLAGVSIWLMYSLHLFYLLLLQVIFAITKNQLFMYEVHGFSACL